MYKPVIGLKGTVAGDTFIDLTKVLLTDFLLDCFVEHWFPGPGLQTGSRLWTTAALRLLLSLPVQQNMIMILEHK